jgi:hypothetical protein
VIPADIILLAGALMTAQPDLAVIPDVVLTVINNTNQPLKCASRRPGDSWSAWFIIAPGDDWEKYTFGGLRELYCQPPVRAVRYSLIPGKRYSLLRSPNGAVELFEVTAGGL